MNRLSYVVTKIFKFMELNSERSRIPFALVLSAVIHISAAILLSFLFKDSNDFQNNRVYLLLYLEKSYQHKIMLGPSGLHIPRKTITLPPKKQSYTLTPQIVPASTQSTQSIQTDSLKTFTEPLQGIRPGTALSPHGARIDSLLTFLEENPRLQNIILREMLLPQGNEKGSLVALRQSIAPSFAHINSTTSIQLTAQRNMQLYGTPYNQSRPYLLRDNIDLIALTFAIIDLLKKL